MLLKAIVALLMATILGALNFTATARCLTEVTKPVSNLRAIVNGADGFPISGAEVIVIGSEGQTLFKTKTRKDGRFTLKKIKADGQLVKIRAKGFLEYSYRLGNSANSIKLETMRLSPNSECRDIGVQSGQTSQ